MSKSIQLLLASVLMLASVTVASAATCEAWYQECARFHGLQTPNWQACMNQPQARYDCGGGGGYGGGGYYPREDYQYQPQQRAGMCGNWHRECARYHGYRTQQWYACMHQPQAMADCGRY